MDKQIDIYIFGMDDKLFQELFQMNKIQLMRKI